MLLFLVLLYKPAAFKIPVYEVGICYRNDRNLVPLRSTGSMYDAIRNGGHAGAERPSLARKERSVTKSLAAR